MLENEVEGREGCVFVCPGLGETVWRCPSERSLFPPQMSQLPWGYCGWTEVVRGTGKTYSLQDTWLHEAQ